MARYIILAVGTILAVLFYVQLQRGEQYGQILKSLDEGQFPLKDLYVAGFAWSIAGPFHFQGKTAARLKREAALLYGEQYAEYYANVAWAQAFTLPHLVLVLMVLLAGLLYPMHRFLIAMGLFGAVIAGVYSLTNMKNTLDKRRGACDAELAEVVSTMAVLLNSGMVLREVWKLVSTSGSGVIYELMRGATDDMNNGVSEIDAIYRFGRLSGSMEVKKFTSALVQSMEKGGAELSTFMERQSSELWNFKRQKLLQSGEKAATKLLLPIMLIFIGILIIVMTAAFAGALF